MGMDGTEWLEKELSGEPGRVKLRPLVVLKRDRACLWQPDSCKGQPAISQSSGSKLLRAQSGIHQQDERRIQLHEATDRPFQVMRASPRDIQI